MRRPPQGDGGEAGPRQPGRGPGSRPGCRRCPRGPGGSQGASPWPGSRGGGPYPGPEEAPAGAHRVGTARGEQAGPQLRSTLAAWEGASRLDAPRGSQGWGRRRASAPLVGSGSGRRSLRPCTSGRETPWDAPRWGGGDTCPKTPAPPPHRNGPAPDQAPPLQAPPPPPAPGGPACPGPALASPSPLRLRPARGLPRPGRASPGRRRRRPGAGVRSFPPWCGRRCRYRRCRSRCRCRGLRSRRRLHRSGDIVPLNRSPRRPAPPARRRDLSATAPPCRHDGEVQAPPSPPPRAARGGGGGQRARRHIGSGQAGHT